jgi:UDP-galactopyranose mutase
MSRFAAEGRVFFFEEHIFTDSASHVEVETCPQTNVNIVVPHLKNGTPPECIEGELRLLLDRLIAEHSITSEHVLWYYTPMAIGFSSHLRPAAVVYDCMDELSAFQGAPAALRQNEQELFRQADVVFTGGNTLYEVKKKQHSNVHAFPSSVDVEHFRRARRHKGEPDDQVAIPHPRLGYIGVIDERMDLELLGQCARLRPDWHFVMVGPVVKIDPDSLPKAANIHYLGGKTYAELPAYLAGWDLAILPFARNESTRFISPTKTPEYLAAGRPVVSTSIRDIVQPYGEAGLVRIADTPAEFVDSAEQLLNLGCNPEWLTRVDEHLKSMSWNRTWAAMKVLIDEAIVSRKRAGAEPYIPALIDSSKKGGEAHV